jgi:hypothetical protein
MARARLNIPASLLTNPESIAETYRAVYIRFLKLYTMHRKPGWDSYTGMMTNSAKTAASTVRGFFGGTNEKQLMHDAKCITTNNDTIIKEINSADTYTRYKSLIYLLNDEAKLAQESSNLESLRTNIYFSIITLIQESIKLQFPAEYKANIDELHLRFRQQKPEYKSRFYSGLSPHEHVKNKNMILTELVLLGDRDIFHKAFKPGRNLFPYLSSMTEEQVNVYTSKLSEQFTLEERKSAKLSPNEILNRNVPYPLQRFFARILLMKEEFKVNDMESFVKAALQDQTMMKSNPSLQVKFYPPISSPTSQPTDIDDLAMAREDSPTGSPAHAEGGNVVRLPVNVPNDNNADMELQDATPHQSPIGVLREEPMIEEADGNEDDNRSSPSSPYMRNL